MDELRGIVPMRFVPEASPPKYDQVIVVSWLEVEVDDTAAERMPILRALRGHRNREVFGFVKDTNGEWFNRLAREMYGGTA